MKRIVVVATTCSGKSTLAKQLCKKLNYKYIWLDELHWAPNWVERPDDKFRELLKAELLGEQTWVADGNYSVIRDILWPKADTIIWLNYGFAFTLWRSVKRSFLRALTKEKQFSGNVETFYKSFFTKDSIIWWMIKTHGIRKKKYPKLFALEEYEHINVVQLKSQKAATKFLAKL